MLNKSRRFFGLLFLLVIFLLSIYNFFVLISSLENRSNNYFDDAPKIPDILLDEENREYEILDEELKFLRKNSTKNQGSRKRLISKRKMKKFKSNKAAELEVISDEKLPRKKKNGIFWPRNVISALKKCKPASKHCRSFREKFYSKQFSIEPATWKKCGRPDNGYGTFDEDIGSFCVRYRYPHDYLVSGEILAFYFAQYLGINVPCVIVERSTNLLQNFHNNHSNLSWRNDVPVALIEWRDSLKVLPFYSRSAKIPLAILSAIRKNRTVNYGKVKGKPYYQRLNIARWSGVIVFDFITGHHDRYTRLMDDAERRNDTNILTSVVPNVGVDKNGDFWLFDNEPAFLDAYELLYALKNDESKKFADFHKRILSSLCIFQKKLLVKISRLYQQDDPTDYLLNLARKYEPNLHILNLKNDSRMLLVKRNFKDRLGKVIEQAKKCSDID
uniref:Uncharacterized protein n=1 Tax=Romanomermis culicivorax TaxID=13658 RepID=A0A915K381_ROMCU